MCGEREAGMPCSGGPQNTKHAVVPRRAPPASSLIDEQSLPSWMQGGHRQNTQPATGATFAAPASQANFSPANLIQPVDLPSWMKSPPQPPVPQNTLWEADAPSARWSLCNSFTTY